MIVAPSFIRAYLFTLEPLYTSLIIDDVIIGEKREIGGIISRPINDANNLRIFLRMGFTSILLDTSSILGTFFIVFMLDFELSVIAFSFIPLAMIIIWQLGKCSRRVYRKTLSTLAGLTGRMQEDLSGIKVTQAFMQENKALRRFKG